MSRFAVDPRWLVYLPPTMAPPRPRTARAARASRTRLSPPTAGGVEQVVCEEKHMGSRAVVVVCRDPRSPPALRHRSVAGGSIFTRTGRPFFCRRATRRHCSTRSAPGSPAPDCGTSSAPTGSCSTASCCPGRPRPRNCCDGSTPRSAPRPRRRCSEEQIAIEAAAARGVDVGDLARGRANGAAMVGWLRRRLSALLLARRRHRRSETGPFQILAGEGKVHALSDHLWHLEILGRLCATDPDNLPGHPITWWSI